MRLTKPQQTALLRKYKQNPDNAASFLEFRRRVRWGYRGEYVILRWCGMYLGIELDGHTHS